MHRIVLYIVLLLCLLKVYGKYHVEIQIYPLSEMKTKDAAPTAMKRVVKEMNQMDKRKHEKFANQFNYALN